MWVVIGKFVLMVDIRQNSGHFQFEPGPNKDISLCSQDQQYAENVKEVQVYLDKVKFLSTRSSYLFRTLVYTA